MNCKHTWYIVVTLITICAVSGCDKQDVEKSEGTGHSEKTSSSEKATGIAEHPQRNEVSPARAELVLPMVLGADSLDDTLYAEIGLDTVRVANSTPTRTDHGAKDQMDSFPRAQLSEADSNWPDKLAEPVAKAKKKAKLLNEEFVRVMSVAADRTLPAGELLALMNGARTQANIQKFKFLGRDPSRLDASDPRSGLVSAANVVLTTGLIQPHAPSDKTPLSLTVDIEPGGFNITADGETLPAIEGCDESGPTICRTEAEVDVAKALQEAQKLQRKGEFEASQKQVRAVLSTYDWAGLYSALSTLKQANPQESTIHIRLEDTDAPVAVLTQLMNTARWKLRAPDAEDGECAEGFATNAEALDAVPCESEQEISKMFPDVALFAAP